jgi:3-oxoacyl-[acyl-carrier protein] reductase
MSGQRLDGRRALVTGASRGIGAAIARRLAAEGARVVVNYNTSAAPAEAVVADIRAAGGEAVAMRADMARVPDVERLVAEAAAWLGGLDILVNNAGIVSNPGIGNAGGTFGKVDEASFDGVFATNVKAVLFGAQAAAPLMPDRLGAIINLGSLMTRQPGSYPLYSTSKSAVMTLTVTIARALAPRGIRVNAIAPGPVDTDMMAANGTQVVNSFIAAVPLGRLGRSEEIASVAAFLASEEASYITGETIPVGGGFR